MASYPTAIRSFVARQDRVDLNLAQDINELQDEVVAIQSVLGVTPQVSAEFPAATTVDARITLLEENVRPRLQVLENRLRRAAVTVRRAAAVQINSGTAWQELVLPDVALALNDYGPTSALYDTAAGRFFSVAPSPALWSFTATVTWESATNAAGSRGLALLTGAGTVLAANEVPGISGEDQTISLSWTGRLPEDPAYYLTLAVKQSQGTALFVRADTGTTPTRADFSHIPG